MGWRDDPLVEPATQGKWQDDPIDPEPEETGTMGFVNRAIAGTVGAPVDIAAAGLSLIPGVDIQEPVGGSESIKKGMAVIGAPTPKKSVRPSTPMEHVGTAIGETAASIIPVAKVLQVLKQGVGLTAQVANIMWQGMTKQPAITAASELTGATGAGLGRFAGEAQTDSPALTGVAEIAGGVAGGLTPAALAYTPVMIAGRLGKTALKKVSLPFTKEGAKFRAGEFIKKQVADPEIARKEVTTETIGELPPAVASGEKRLMTLYNQFRELDPVVDAKASQKISHSIYQLEQELRGLGYGAPDILQDIAKKRVTSIEGAMQKRIADALGVADKKLNALPVATRQSKESAVVRSELEKVRKQESDFVKTEWDKVPKELEVGYSGSKQAYKDLLGDISEAQKGDIPSVLKRSFLAREKVKFPVNVKEMQGLRSKLLEVQRAAKQEGQWNKARIAGDIADSILDDLSEGAGGALEIAIAATRQFKERFERGIVGKVLGYSKSGAPSISPELTLDVSIGRSGIKGAIDIDKVVVTPEARAATERYLTKSFTDYVTDKGTKGFNVNRANKWVENNVEVLDQFPELRTNLSDVAGSQKIANDTLSLMTARQKKLQDPRISMTAKFLKSEPSSAIKDVFKGKNPGQKTRHLVKLAKKDTTGEAMEGLKGSYITHIIENSSVGPYNELGEQTLAGSKLHGFLNKNRGVLRQVFEPEELVRMDKIGSELAKLELAEKATGRAVKIEMDDVASNFLRLASRVGGAQVGRQVAGLTGGGTVQTPGIFSERFKNFAQHLTKDRAAQLINDAIMADDGGKLLEALLLPIDKPTTRSGQANLQKLNKRMNLWLMGTGSIGRQGNYQLKHRSCCHQVKLLL
jgi:hypothetical protein